MSVFEIWKLDLGILQHIPQPSITKKHSLGSTRRFHIYIYIYIQLPCGPSPPPCLLRSLFFVLCSSFHKAQRKQTHKATTTTKNGVQNWPKIMKKWRPGGSRRLLGEVLGPFWFQGSPGDEKDPKTDLATPPPGTRLGSKFWLFVDSVVLFPVVFLSVVLEGVRVQF